MQTTYILTNAAGNLYLADELNMLWWHETDYACKHFDNEAQIDTFLMREDVKAFLDGEFVRMKQF